MRQVCEKSFVNIEEECSPFKVKVTGAVWKVKFSKAKPLPPKIIAGSNPYKRLMQNGWLAIQIDVTDHADVKVEVTWGDKMSKKWVLIKLK